MFHLDHIVYKVKNLAEATAHFQKLGFTVVQGGEHPRFNSHNALIAFADGSYIELLAWQARMPEEAKSGPVGARWAEWERRPVGLVDWAITTEDLEGDLAKLRTAGQAWHGPFPGSRRRPDGVWVEWNLVVPDSLELPFICADVTPREWRVPQGAALIHANGATGIESVRVKVADLAEWEEHYDTVFGESSGGLAWPDEPRSQISYDVGPTVLYLHHRQKWQIGANRVVIRLPENRTMELK